MTVSNSPQSESQYSLIKIIVLWVAVALPLGFMSWVIFPAIAPDWGIDPMGVGYASIQITLDTCAHVAPGLQEAAAAGFDKMVFPRRENAAVENH